MATYSLIGSNIVTQFFGIVCYYVESTLSTCINSESTFCVFYLSLKAARHQSVVECFSLNTVRRLFLVLWMMFNYLIFILTFLKLRTLNKASVEIVTSPEEPAIWEKNSPSEIKMFWQSDYSFGGFWLLFSFYKSTSFFTTTAGKISRMELCRFVNLAHEI